MLLILGACSGRPEVQVATLPQPMPADLPPAAHPGRSLRLLQAHPSDGSLVQPLLNLRLEFDRALDPASIRRAVTLDHPEAGVTFLADPFRHVRVWLEGGGRTLVVEPPEMLVGREVRVRLSADLRGADGSRAAPDMPMTLTYRVMELPP